MASCQVQKATSSEKEVKQPQNGAQATMFNQTPSTMRLSRLINWSGTPAYPGFPGTIPPNSQAMFNHLSDGDFGSTAAVIYNGLNAQGQPSSWVLAWDAPAESDQKPNRVYVTCGPESQIDNLEFSEIRKRLSESGPSSAAKDPGTKTSANANISDRVPNKAVIGADFALIP